MTMKRYSDAEAQKLWDDKFTFFWYNEPEIFHWSQNDFDACAAAMHQAHITVAMTFSSTHFRWSYLRWENEILATLTKLVAACHKYGIKVVEHHSCHLTWKPKNDVEWRQFGDYLKLHFSSFEGFHGLKDAVSEDPEINGKPISSWYQIDGRTAQPAETGYIGHAFCFNNPDYRRAYFEYVGELKKTGVDMVLADDVQYFGAGNACTCRHCRKLFTETTGYTLPDPEHWAEFFNHFERPDFLAWRRFRTQSTRDFQLALTEHYRRLGIEPYRPNYRSTLIGYDQTANSFTNSLELWAHTFQENCFSCVLRLYWPIWYCEAMLQYSMGRRKNAPSMSLFYPARYDQYYFSWALAESWGQLPFLCPEGANMPEEDAFFNRFENAHRDLFREPAKIADLTFLMSRETLDLTPDSSVKTSNVLRMIMQGAYFSNLSVDMLSEDEPSAAFQRCKLLVCVGIRRVSVELLAKLEAFVDHGGKLVIVDAFAEFDPPSGVAEFLARPEIVRRESDFGTELYVGLSLRRMFSDTQQQGLAPANGFEALKRGPGAWLRGLLPELPTLERVSDGWLATVYRMARRPDTLAVHLMNIRGLLPEGNAPVTHEDPIVNFEKGAPPVSVPATVVLNCGEVRDAALYSPERPDALAVAATVEDGKTVLTIPAGTISGYAVIAVTLK